MLPCSECSQTPLFTAFYFYVTAHNCILLVTVQSDCIVEELFFEAVQINSAKYFHKDARGWASLRPEGHRDTNGFLWRACCLHKR